MTTRGVQKIKDYLGSDVAALVRSKRASDVVPVLSARKAATEALTAKTAAATRSAAGVSAGLSSNVTEYLQEQQNVHGNDIISNKFTKKQMQTVAALSRLAPLSEDGSTSLSVKRVQQGSRRDMANVVAVTALERAGQRITVEASSLLSPEQRAQLPESSVFVLADSEDLATYLVESLKKHFGLPVLALVGADKTPRHPTFPGVTTTPTVTPNGTTKGKKSKVSKQVRFDANTATDGTASALISGPALAARACVIVGTLEGFLTVDKRSAIWKYVGAVVVTVEGNHKTSPLLKTLAGDVARCHELAAHREACLGHVPLFCVMATTHESLVAPPLDWCTTLSPGTEEATDKHVSAKPAPSSTVVVHFTVAQGIRRFQFLFGLLKGLVPHRGLVVHVATKETCAFLYDALYAFMDTEVPHHVQLMSDYEGESTYASVKSAEDLDRLSSEFDAIVDPAKSEAEKTSAVLLTCRGLVPARGSIFLAYDMIIDVPNFPRFVAERLVPTAVDAAARACGAQRSTAVRKRGRSRSPSPTPFRQVVPKTEASSTAATTLSAQSPLVPHYPFILLLLRPNEVKGIMHHLQGSTGGTGVITANGVRLVLTSMEKPGVGGGHDARHLFIGEKLQSMNRKIFAIQNAAYAAYKATMTAYCTMGPRDVYDEQDVDLNSVAAEFGYTELPLLDLRLKDTPFRPKEDYFKAAKKKLVREQKQYKKFVDANIVGEQPEDHMADL